MKKIIYIILGLGDRGHNWRKHYQMFQMDCDLYWKCAVCGHVEAYEEGM